MVLPKTLGACADKLYALRQQRLDLQRQVDAIQEQESALKEHIIQTLPKSDASGVSGKVASVAVITKQIPQVSDWTKFYQYVKRTGQFELMQRRLSDQVIKERWEDGKEIPGVSHFTTVSVSVTKV